MAIRPIDMGVMVGNRWPNRWLVSTPLKSMVRRIGPGNQVRAPGSMQPAKQPRESLAILAAMRRASPRVRRCAANSPSRLLLEVEIRRGLYLNLRPPRPDEVRCHKADRPRRVPVRKLLTINICERDVVAGCARSRDTDDLSGVHNGPTEAEFSEIDAWACFLGGSANSERGIHTGQAATMAQRKKRPTVRKEKSATRRKARKPSKSARARPAKRIVARATPRKRLAKAKGKPAAKKARKKVGAMKPPTTPVVETVVVDVIEEPVPGVTVVTEIEATEVRDVSGATPAPPEAEEP